MSDITTCTHRFNVGETVNMNADICHRGTPVGNREVAMKKLEEGKKSVVCIECEKRVPLWDDLEDRFASDELQIGRASCRERVSVLV